MNLTINEIAKACGGTLVLQGDRTKGDANVSAVAIDSRKAEAGGVFVAVSGERVDGHRFVGNVYEKGIVLTVVEKSPEEVEKEHGIPKDKWGSYLMVKDSLQALRDMAEAYRRKLDVKVVGITGSAGKTSTKELTAAVLSEKYKVLKTEGNLNNEIGVPLTLLRIRQEHQVAVVEMGISDFGEMHRLSKMARPDICVITNIGQSHLKDLKTRDGILKAKSEIFDYMAQDGEICLNGEDDKLIEVREINGRRPHFFGLGGDSSEEVLVEESIGRGLWGSDATMLMKKGVLRNKESLQEVRVQVHIPLPGSHMLQNAAAAACVAGLLGLTGEEIAAGMAKAAPVGGRDNLIRLPRNTFIDGCYNANPASMKAAIDLLALADTKKVAILGDMFNLGENSHDYHGEMGSYAVEKGVDLIICVGEESRHMYAEAQRSMEEARMCERAENSDERQGYLCYGAECSAEEKTQRAVYFPDRKALMEALNSGLGDLVPEGATVLVKASHGMEFIEVLDFLQNSAAAEKP